jgi:hypothetical protein
MSCGDLEGANLPTLSPSFKEEFEVFVFGDGGGRTGSLPPPLEVKGGGGYARQEPPLPLSAQHLNSVV